MARILEFLKMTFVVIVFGGFLLFVADWLTLLWKIHQHGNAFGTVQVYHVTTAGLKNGKTEIFPGETEDQTCVHSLFPHQNFTPCWYLEKHTDVIEQY